MLAVAWADGGGGVLREGPWLPGEKRWRCWGKEARDRGKVDWWGKQLVAVEVPGMLQVGMGPQPWWVALRGDL